MVKQKDEISVFFSVPVEVIKNFEIAMSKKSKELGVVLNKKQAYSLALKEITELWTREKPGNQ